MRARLCPCWRRSYWSSPKADGGYPSLVAAFTTERVPVGLTELYVLKGGSGRPLVVLHGVEGHEGWLAFHAAMAEASTVYAPSHPGYGHTECPDWISSIPH